MIKFIKKSIPTLKFDEVITPDLISINELNENVENINLHTIKNIDEFDEIKFSIELDVLTLYDNIKPNILYFGLHNVGNIMTGMMLQIKDFELIFQPLYKNKNFIPNENIIGKLSFIKQMKSAFVDKKTLILKCKFKFINDNIEITYGIGNNSKEFITSHKYKKQLIKFFLISTDDNIFIINNLNKLIGEK